MLKKFKVGAVGAGHATQTLTVPAFKLLDGSLAELRAICDPNQNLVQQIGLEHNLDAYTSMEEMIQKEALDVVIINAPIALHAVLAIKAFELGCDVIIEKPAVAKIEELEQIKQASERTKKIFTVVHNYKFCTGPQLMEQWFKAGILGDIIQVDRIWMSPPQGDRMEMDTNGWWHKATGGRLADALPHMLYEPYMFVGEMELLAVSARKLAVDRPWSFCDETNIMLSTPKAYVNIRESTNQKSWPYKGYIYHTYVYGTKLSAVCNHREAMIIQDGSKGARIKGGLTALQEWAAEKFIRRTRPLFRGGHDRFYEEFFKHLNGDAANPTSYEEAYNVSLLTDQISKKIEEGIKTNKKIVIA